jgi:superfamily II DNA or RNA helicase
MPVPELHFHEGTLLLKNWTDDHAPPCFEWDNRSGAWRALAIQYSTVCRIFKQSSLVFKDAAARFEKMDIQWKLNYEPYPYQQEAVDAWIQAGMRGSILLPTGSGKTIVALHAIAQSKTSTLVVCPTLDLMHQWYDRIIDAFSIDVGLLGGGHHEILPFTVATYDSAYRHIDRYGNRFGLLIFDEIHHLPASGYRQIPELSIAPYRLGLTATYRRSDSRHVDLNHLVGNIVFEKTIKDMTGAFLADYEIHRIRIPLTESEKAQYEQSNTSYSGYVRDQQIRFYGEKWQKFIRQSGYSPEARRAMLARKAMQHIVFGAEKKLTALESLLKQHTNDRIIIFTQDNALVYKISTTYLIPALTHQTEKIERKEILQKFRTGAYRYLVTSKVLNEGVDVPEANVAIILGGSASTTEHLQRLGRILRKKSRKKALLYEIVTEGTRETNISYRRRQSDAYR